MKVSVVPAQITTVEDRIAGNLNFTQILLLSAPEFLVAGVFLIVPPFGHFSLAKVVISVVIAGSISSLAIRWHDKILLELLKLRISYLIRPHIYVLKRQAFQELETRPRELYRPSSVKRSQQTSARLSSPARASSQQLLTSASYSVLFKAKSGGLSVEVNNLK